MIGWKRVLRKLKMEKLASQKGLTLTELLASIVILGMVGMVLGGGVMMVKNVTQKTQEKSNAEQVLNVAAQLMSDEFAYAMEVDSESGTATDPGKNVRFLSGENGLWVRFDTSGQDASGILKVYGKGDSEQKIALMTPEAVTDAFYTSFDRYTYSKSDACFVVENLAVYRKSDTEGTTPVAKLPQLKVRAVNLDK